MSMTSTEMGSIVTPAGKLTVTVFYDNAYITSGTHIPTASGSFINIGELIDTFDIPPNSFAIPDMSITLRENYDHYADGVWNRMLNGETQFRFYLDEGAGDTFFFWGTVNKQSTTFDEIAYVNGTTIRTASIQLLSRMKEIENATIVSIRDDILDYRVSTYTDSDHGYPSAYFYKISDIFESIVYKAFGGSFGSRVTFPSAANHDMQYKFGATWYNIQSLYGYGKYGSPIVTESSLLIGSTAMAWEVYFSNGLELLAYLCRSFGLIPRITCNISTGVIGMRLYQRGNEDAITLPDQKGGSYTLSNAGNDEYRAKSREGYTDDGYSGTTILIDYLITYIPFWDKTLFVMPSAPNMRQITGFRYLDVSQEPSAYVETGHTTGVGDYYTKRFTKQARTYERTYKGIKGSDDAGATWSHEKIAAGIVADISDGATTRTCYANEIRKNILSNETYIQWIEE